MAKYKCCNYPNCNKLTNDTYCDKHKRQKSKNYNSNRPKYSKMYNCVRWRKERLLFLKENALCINCVKENKIVPATVVDHVIDHKGDYDLFWDNSNWQGLCVKCHNKKNIKQEVKKIMDKSILIIKVNKELQDFELIGLKDRFQNILGNEFKIIMVDGCFDFAIISNKDKNILLSNIKEIDIDNILKQKTLNNG